MKTSEQELEKKKILVKKKGEKKKTGAKLAFCLLRPQC